MPLYRAVGIKISLRVVDIAGTITLTPAKSRSKEVTASTAEIELTIANSPALVESSITNDGSHGVLSFVGPVNEYPMMIVHASDTSGISNKVATQPAVKAALAKLEKVLSSVTTTKTAQEHNDRTATRGTVTTTPDTTRAVSEPVSASTESALSTLLAVSAHLESLEADKDRNDQIQKLQQFLSKADKASVQLLTPKSLGIVIDLPSRLFFLSPVRGRRDNDIKIEVFFNGQLAHAQTLMARLHGNKRIVISGRRVGLLTERPWLILPPGQGPDGSLKPTRHVTNFAAGQERWSNVQDLLKAEAYYRGLDDKGIQPHSGGYLDALSACEFPDLSEHLHKANAAYFGVIDIIVTLSEGKRGHGGGLWAFSPKRIPDEHYKVETPPYQTKREELSDKSDSLAQSSQIEDSQASIEGSFTDQIEIDELQSMPSTPMPTRNVEALSQRKQLLGTGIHQTRRPRSLYWLKPDVIAETVVNDVDTNSINTDTITSCSTPEASQLQHIPTNDANSSLSVGGHSEPLNYAQSSPYKRIRLSPGSRDIVDEVFTGQDSKDSPSVSFEHSLPLTPPETESTRSIFISSSLDKSISDTVTHASQSDGSDPVSSFATVTNSNIDSILMPPPSSLPNPTKKGTKRKRMTAKTATLRPVKTTQSLTSHPYPDPCPQPHGPEFDWVTPALSRDSVCTYAEPGTMMTDRSLAGSGDPMKTGDTTADGRSLQNSTARYAAPSPAGHVFRHIKSMRDGEFRETEVVLGVRYIVG